MLQIQNFSIQTRVPILENFSYNFSKGNIYGLVAVNGSGKTTFFRSVMNLIKRKSGSVTINNKNIQNQLSSVFFFETSDWLDENLSGYDYLTFIKKTWNSKKNINQVVKYWSMSEFINLPIKKYSLGMKQKLIISLYQISDADYLFMDEITNGLDANSRELFFNLINNLSKIDNKMIIISSHYKDDISKNCDYLLTLENSTIEVESI